MSLADDHASSREFDLILDALPLDSGSGGGDGLCEILQPVEARRSSRF
jgi:hypothetical protein